MSDNKEQRDRLLLFVDYLNITKKAFEEATGLSNGYIGSIRKGIGHKAIELISNQYPELNISWLLTGEGKMLKENVGNEEGSSKFADNNLIFNLKDTETMTILSEMMTVITRQSLQIDRLITEMEKSSERTDRMLDIIEHVNGIGGSQKKQAV